ncbi:hypothetical protein HAZT_HAZT002348 [Hyalella azteca]|uniref:EGF-like domain-containing protein n=1 Tax=Hyalella azteca TaxID=294128 RepID=A0A6A0H6V2_HYAAZ|nr:hypothetical protein HAZT_HAZT002348 [Hyalella azteca]
MTSRCADGYISTIDNVVAEPPIWNQTCEAGKWKDDQRQFPSRLSTSDADPRPTNLPDASPILQRNCTAICERFCLNGGVCVEPNRYPENEVVVQCLPGYAIKKGITRTSLALYPVGSLACSAVCQKPCLNNGVCVAPEKCKCPDGFAGDHCQVKKCSGAPEKIQNSMMIFSDDFLNGVSRCRSGYKLPNGDIAAGFDCVDGMWIYQEVWIPAGYSRTVNGSSCVFPFVFRGTRHFGCTGAGHSVPWCATAVTDTEEVVAWDVCVADLGMKKVVLTEDHKQCVFPFVYRGTEYHRCTTTERGRGWCATQVHQKVMVKWSYCAADQGGKLVALTSEGIPCQLPFQYGNQAYLSCVDDTRSPWCVVGEKHSVSTSLLRDGSYVTSPQTEIVYGVCLAHWGHKKVQVTRQGHLCTFPFEFEDRMHSTCVYNSSAPPVQQ